MKIWISLSLQFFLFYSIDAQENSSYLGQNPPGLEPRLFAEEFLPKGAYLHTVSFTPDGKECYFTAESRAYNGGTIMVSKFQNNKWTSPEPANIPGDFREIDPLITPGGSAMLYCTNRPISKGDLVTSNMDMWMLKRTGNSWSEPIHLGNEVNTSGQDWFPTISESGKLYFSPWIGNVSNIHTSSLKNEVYGKSEKLSDAVNSTSLDYDPFIAPDERFLIFCSDRANGFGDVDLYVCFKKEDGSWTKAKNMGEVINTEGAEFAPTISPDGQYLFFARDRQIYWVKAGIIEQLR